MTWKSFWEGLWRGLSDTRDSETGDAKSGGASDDPTPPDPPPVQAGSTVQGVENATNTFDTNAMNTMGQTAYSQLNSPHW